MLAQQAQNLAAYNEWMNSRLYAVCAELDDTQRRRDMGAFFKSVHGTLNHILLADELWMARFRGETYTPQGLDQELFHDFAELRQARQIMDEKILSWAGSLTDDLLAGKLSYTSVVNPQTRTYDMGLAVTHFFNHQTHHRGQLCTLLSQLGKNYGVTDLIWLPQVVTSNERRVRKQ